MLELRDHLHLAQEALRAHRLGNDGLKYLDRDRPMMAEVLGQVHDRHATSTDLALDPVATFQSGGQASGDVFAHGVTGIAGGPGSEVVAISGSPPGRWQRTAVPCMQRRWMGQQPFWSPATVTGCRR